MAFKKKVEKCKETKPPRSGFCGRAKEPQKRPLQTESIYVDNERTFSRSSNSLEDEHHFISVICSSTFFSPFIHKTSIPISPLFIEVVFVV